MADRFSNFATILSNSHWEELQWTLAEHLHWETRWDNKQRAIDPVMHSQSFDTIEHFPSNARILSEERDQEARRVNSFKQAYCFPVIAHKFVLKLSPSAMCSKCPLKVKNAAAWMLRECCGILLEFVRKFRFAPIVTGTLAAKPRPTGVWPLAVSRGRLDFAAVCRTVCWMVCRIVCRMVLNLLNNSSNYNRHLLMIALILFIHSFAL